MTLPEQSFSDEQLTKLKDRIEKENAPEELKALLARLEAAELFASKAIYIRPALECLPSYKAWRKAAGR